MSDRPDREIENDVAKPGMKEEMDRQQDASEDMPGDVHSKTELRRNIRTQLQVTKDRNRDVLNEFREGMDRRTFLKVLGFGLGGTVLAATVGGVMARELLTNRVKDGQTLTGYAGTAIADAPGSNEIHASTLGDALNNFQSGNKVILEGGKSYDWDGDGIFGNYNNASLIGDGPVELQVPEGTNVHGNITGSEVMIKNITIRGRQGGGKNRINLQADAGSRVIAENFNQPDGADGDGHPSPIGFYLGDNLGEVHIRSCHIEGFYNNGIYGGSYYKEGDGRQIVEGCFLKNNDVDHLRMGGHNDLCRETVFVSDGTGAYSGGRGIRVRYGGQNQHVENAHFAWADGGEPFRVGEGQYMEGSPTVTVNGLFIRNETSSTAVRVGSDGETTGENICLKGSGDLSVEGGSFTNVRRGSECTETIRSEPPEDINYTGGAGYSGPTSTSSTSTGPC